MFTKKATFIEHKLDLSILKKRFKYEVKYLRDYINFSSESVEIRSKQLEDKIFKDTEDDAENESLLQDIYLNEIQTLSGYFYHSAIVLVYTVFESNLSQLCLNIQKDTNYSFSPKKLGGGNIIGRAMDYLILTSSFSFDNIKHEWSRIGQFQKLRNQIVHQNSMLKEKDIKELEQKQKEMIAIYKDIEISDDGRRFFIRNKNLVIEFLEKVEEFMNKVFVDIESKTYLIPK